MRDRVRGAARPHPCLTAMLVLAVSCASSTSAAEPDWIAPTLAALDAHLERHPAAEAEDVYKLLHQAVTGPGHAVNDPTSARRWLDREIAGLAPTGFDVLLCEPIGGDPAMVRIHLRPFVEAGLDPGELLDTFVATADGMPPAIPGRLDAVVRAAIAQLRGRGTIDRADGLERLRVELSTRGFPAIRHSPGFRSAYAPAYRVVRLGLAEAAGWCDDLAALDDTGPSDADADVDAGRQGGS